MLPEMAIGYAVGLVPSGIVSVINVYRFYSKRKSKKIKTLQSNLEKLNLFWSDSTGSVENLDRENIKLEETKQKFSIFIFSFVTFFFSWFGFFLNIFIYISLRLLNSSQLERKILDSKLTQSELDKSEVQNILNGLSSF